MEDLETKLEESHYPYLKFLARAKFLAESKPVRKGFLSKEVVDYQWEERELA